ncbi:hypothetical protein GCM10027275_40750 [Rhabdobacter roseus]|uniref:Heat shock protein HslJ n=1 Tax=Rhabdobacter roseus TaxID=1655419 RepID=A0A840U2H8_9BACT|nr:META domain-containing protein [Rhabdobacter roseus]MBB5286049.1 heat shock protein HslJ [Rhabdobacter roseus]
MRKVKSWGWALAGLVLFLSSCQDKEPTPSAMSPERIQAMRTSFQTLEGQWVLKNFEKNPLPSSLENKATLIFEKQSDNTYQLGGRSFVNWFGGTFTLDEEKGLLVAHNNVISTLIGGPPAESQAESRYYEALQKAQFFELTDNGTLKIYAGEPGKASTEVMIFVKP